MTTTSTTNRRRSPSARARILGWYMGLLAVSLVAALFLQRAFLLTQAETEVEQALDQEIGELRQLAGGIDPDTGEPFGGDSAAIFDTFLARNVPLEGEGILTFVDGRLYKTDLTGSLLATDPITDTWARITNSQRGEVDTDQGPVRYLAVPLLAEDGEPAGVFAVAVLMAERLADVDRVVRLGAAVYGSIFLLASVLAWIAAGGVLRPLRLFTDTARSITESDLSRRIPVEGDDEIAELGRTFNSMLDRLDEAFATQRRFVDDAGHELRTPITVIRGNLELMGADPDERAATVALVTDELDRMSRIVDDLLILAKADRPDFVQPSPIDLAELTEEVAAKAVALDDRPFIVEQVNHAVITADRQRLTQAMMNLLRNAAEHTPEGTPVHIGSGVEDGRARLWVRDEGAGIRLSDRDRIFDRFSRASTSRRSSKGAGLGLAIVAAIAEAHGGTVTYDAPPEGGSLFTLTIPTTPAEDEPA